MRTLGKIRGQPDSPVDSATVTRRDLMRVSLVSAAALFLAACSPVTTTPSTGGAGATVSNAAVSLPVAASATPVGAATAPTVPAGTTASTGQAQTLLPTASSVDVAEVTPSLTEGPYFKPNSPERTSLVDSTTTGARLTLTGRVLSTRAQPIAQALIDFWQADPNGAYDNAGYTLRGHQFTNAQGQYQLVTVIPGLYPGRTRHIHVKVQAPNQPVLTTQLFFPNEAQNASDGIFSPKLVLPIQDAPNGDKVATFNFVVSAG